MTQMNPRVLSRRSLFKSAGGIALSAGAVSMLAGVKMAVAGPTEDDVKILNIALGLEHEAINAYQLGATSGLLQKPTLEVALLFQSHHKAHRDTLVTTIKKMGGSAVAEKSLDQYAKDLRADTLKSQIDVLTLAAKLELGATNAYLGVIPSFKDAALAKIAARLAADETSHWSFLNYTLGKAPPTEAMSFGA